MLLPVMFLQVFFFCFATAAGKSSMAPTFTQPDDTAGPYIGWAKFDVAGGEQVPYLAKYNALDIVIGPVEFRSFESSDFRIVCPAMGFVRATLHHVAGSKLVYGAANAELRFNEGHEAWVLSYKDGLVSFSEDSSMVTSTIRVSKRTACIVYDTLTPA